MNHDRENRMTRTSKRIAWWLAAMLLAVACVELGLQKSSTASGDGKFWYNAPPGGEKLVPAGYNPMPSLASLVDKLKPAVVNVYTTQVIKPKVKKRGQMPMFRDPMLKEFFGGRNPFEHFFGGPQRVFKRQSLGSGFVISPDGYVLTNAHVVANADEIKVRTVDEKELEAKVIGSDPKTDVALLKVDTEEKLPHAVLGDSDALRVGDWVIAIGNPFGLGHTVTAGIISGKDRVIGHGPYDDFLQTDASINQGNSGGPLFDSSGRVVGINTAIIPGGAGIGFAVPIDLAEELLPQLKETGKVTRGWLGVGIQELTDDLAEKFDAEGVEGVLVSQVFEDSPADHAGLKAGDIILSVDGEQTDEVRVLTREIASIPPGSRAKVKVRRGDDTRTFEVKLGERAKGEKVARGGEGGAEAEPAETDLGLSLVPLTAERARKIGVDEDLKGLVITQVDPAGPAAGILKPGDVILEVDRERVTDLEAFRDAMPDDAKQVLLRVQRGNSQIYLVVTPE